MASAPSAFILGTNALAVAASSAKVSPFTPEGVTTIRRALQRHADEADGDWSKALDASRRKDRRAVALHDVGGQVAEPRPGERLDRTRFAAGKLRAAAGLHPLQLVAASVEFVIAD